MLSTTAVTHNAPHHDPPFGGGRGRHPRARNAIESYPFRSSSISRTTDVSPLLLAVLRKHSPTPARRKPSNLIASEARRPLAPHRWTKSNLNELNAAFDSHRVIKDFNPPVFIPPEVEARMTLPQPFVTISNVSCSHREGSQRI